MKKLLMYFFIFIGAVSVNGQHTGLYVGLHGAFQNTWILNPEDNETAGELDFKSTFKTAFGLDLGYNLNSNIGIQTGLIYSQQGQDYITKGNANANYETDLTYLKIPILFCYHLKPEKKLSFVANAGFQLGLLSKAKSSREITAITNFGIYSSLYQDVERLYNSSVMEFVIGFGLQYKIQKMSFSLSVKSDYSLSDIEKAEAKKNLRSPTSNFTIAIPQLGFQYYFN